jgi:general secretion pathway protein C
MALDWLNRLQQQAPKLIPCAVWLLLIITGVLAARLTWYLIEPVPELTVRPLPVTGSVMEQSPQSATVDVDDNLFGEYQPEAVEAAPVIEAAPETRLNLVLQGVFASDNPENGSAVISKKGGSGDFFTTGKDVFGQAILRQVFSNRVILERNGQFETLKFEDTPSTGGTIASNSSAGRSIGNQSDRSGAAPIREPNRSNDDVEDNIGQMLTDLRDEALDNPEGLIRRMGLEVTDDGYQVTRRARQLMAFGLRPGDVVVAVNDQQVGNIAQDQLLIDQLSVGGDVKIEIQRGSRRFSIYHTIPAL